ncbi:hypothetical protein N7462_001299 [Penicillium macrosclerotiorum]|uniref:uncharacterized protein n=1 Tax=Penicillium macrosclerotiorum TaxID=303699 RepID=UPI0025471C77|nr:uncharacterized protein N7462_001299 [Penicillium macrosclerotiorum]KAJ5691876.1 hypothetical protein N7462_001299 [Penicillium macrosclerotiorum]
MHSTCRGAALGALGHGKTGATENRTAYGGFMRVINSFGRERALVGVPSHDVAQICETQPLGDTHVADGLGLVELGLVELEGD